MNQNELYHYGVLGMKWGVRRYHNSDGSLNSAGKKKAAKLENRYSQLTGGRNIRKKKISAQITTAKTQSTKKIHEYTNSELREKVNRLRLEKDYLDLKRQVNSLNGESVSKGKKRISKLVNRAVNEIVVSSAISVGRDLVREEMKRSISLKNKKKG